MSVRCRTAAPPTLLWMATLELTDSSTWRDRPPSCSRAVSIRSRGMPLKLVEAVGRPRARATCPWPPARRRCGDFELPRRSPPMRSCVSLRPALAFSAASFNCGTVRRGSDSAWCKGRGSRFSSVVRAAASAAGPRSTHLFAAGGSSFRPTRRQRFGWSANQPLSGSTFSSRCSLRHTLRHIPPYMPPLGPRDTPRLGAPGISQRRIRSRMRRPSRSRLSLVASVRVISTTTASSSNVAKNKAVRTRRQKRWLSKPGSSVG